MTEFNSEDFSQAESHEQGCDASDQRQQIVFPSDAHHALEELAAIENADAVKNHDQAGEADRTDDLGLRRERADRKTDKENRTYPEGEPADTDLAGEIA